MLPFTRQSTRVALLAWGGLALVLAGFPLLPASAQEPPAGIRLEKILDGADIGRVLGLVFSNDGTGRMFLVQQSGEIRILLPDGQLQPKSFLNLSKKITCCDNERGLLGLAFHPDYENNGYFYVVYSDRQSRTVVSRFSVSSNPDSGDLSSEERLLRWDQPELPHNGGAILFGPDGYLYLGAGDGGTRDAAGDLESLLGSILRIDVDSAFPYAVPPDNPYVGDPNALDEIWVSGLRNPWRFSLDRRNGDLFVGDVGAAQFEEISYQAAANGGGANFGWPVKEGPRCIAGEGDPGCEDPELVSPIIAYRHKENTCNAVTGGYRYRGAPVPTLTGSYLYGDFCRGDIWGARRNGAGNWVPNELLQSGLLITTFAEAPNGDLYLAHYRGDIYKIVGQDLFASDFESGDTLDWTQRRGKVAVVPGGLRKSGSALEVPLGGGKSFLRSKHPSSETTFRLGFDLDLSNSDPAEQAAEILRLAGKSKRGHLRLTLQRLNGKVWLNLLVRGDTGGFFHAGRTVVPAARTIRIELDWMAASVPGANDGEALLFKNGKARIVATQLDTDRAKVNAVTLGLPASSSGSGFILLDNYVSSP